MEEKHQKVTEIAEEFIKALLETFGETKQTLSVETGNNSTSSKQMKRKSGSEIF